MKSNKVTRIKFVILFVALWCNFSCSKPAEQYDITSENVMLEETGELPDLNTYEVEGPVKRKKGNSTNQKIIRNATTRIKANNVEEATRLAKKIASEYQGYVSDERFTNTNHTKENRFTVRIPQDDFDLVLERICQLAEFVDHKNISTIDVTEEYVDISSRLKTKLEVKQRYEHILRTRAKTVEDILKTEDKLKQLQEEIESAQGRLRYLSTKVAYSTIQVDAYEIVIPKPQPEQYQPKFSDKVKMGLTFGWSLIENGVLVLFYI